MLVSLPHGGSTFVGEGQIRSEADVTPARPYTLRAEQGEAGEQVSHAGLSVRRLVSLAGANPDDFGYLTVPRADGTTAYLAASDFAEPPPFAEGPALVWVDANSTHFFRPVLEPGEANAADNIATPGGEALQLGVHDGNLLKVVALASSRSPGVGEAVHLSATAGGALPAEAVAFQWRFGDGTSAAGAGADHSFAAAGTYEVTVTATGSEESGGESAPVQIVVGDPPQRARTGAGPDAGAKPHGANGRGGGAGEGSGPVAAGEGIGQSGAAGAGGSGDGGPQSGAGAGGSASGAGAAAESSSSAMPTAAASTSTAAAPAGETSSQPAAAERTVSGVLIADASAPAATASGERASAAPVAQPSSASAPSSGGFALPLGLLALAALLGAGALYEWRGAQLGSRW